MKRIFTIIAVSLLAISVNAQKIGGGLQIGTGYSWLTVNSKEASADKGRAVFSFGAFGDYNFTDNFAFSLGVNLLMNGGTVKYNNPTNFEWDDETYVLAPNSLVTYKLQNIEIPFSLKGMTQEIGYITYFGRVGGNVSFSHIVKGDIEGTAVNTKTVIPATDTEKLNLKKNVNPFNVGWHVGGGIEYSLGGSTAMIAELIFSQNFISIGRKKVTDPFKSFSVKPNLIALKVGIKF